MGYDPTVNIGERDAKNGSMAGKSRGLRRRSLAQVAVAIPSEMQNPCDRAGRSQEVMLSAVTFARR
jgi:hypothetical protein